MSDEAASNGLLARVEEFIGDELRHTERIFHRELESRSPYVAEVLGHVARFRGKRLRPILLLLSAKACGSVTDDHLVLAAVVEMIHTATLVHDDVLDDAASRRHVSTVNSRWNNETSVLLGDFLFTHAFHLASSLPSTLACRVIGRATNIVCEGELNQISHRGNYGLSEAEYLRIIEAKTAELCAVSCRLGAHFANADETTADAMEQYGRSLGISFQIADDILDLCGDERDAGKSLGSDVKKQKLTLPLIRLLQSCDDGQADELHNVLLQADDRACATLVGYLRDSDAIDYTRAVADSHAATARRQLHSFPASPAREILEQVSEFVVTRSF